jgi:hypothetical protein
VLKPLLLEMSRRQFALMFQESNKPETLLGGGSAGFRVGRYLQTRRRFDPVPACRNRNRNLSSPALAVFLHAFVV